MRIDQFSENELRECHATILELASQIRELQERTNCMNDSREFQDIESICRGKLSHVPSQLAVVPSPRSMLSRDQSLRFNTDTLSRNSSLCESKCHKCNPSAGNYRETCCER